jgi:hypothetical protein
VGGGKALGHQGVINETRLNNLAVLVTHPIDLHLSMLIIVAWNLFVSWSLMSILGTSPVDIQLGRGVTDLEGGVWIGIRR